MRFGTNDLELELSGTRDETGMRFETNGLGLVVVPIRSLGCTD